MSKWVLAVAFALSLAVPPVYSQATVNMGRTYTGPLNVQYANEAGTGTTVNKLAKLTGAPSTAIITAIADTSGIVGIVVSGAGTVGSAQIAFKGKHSCVFDSATTAGHYVTNDTSTAGDCMDAGATYPTTGQVIGVVTSTNGGAGTYEVDLTLGQPQAGGAGGGNSTSTGTFATNPGACTDGDVRFPSDSFYIMRCASNAWIPWGPLYPMVAPVSGDFAWVNQGGASVTTTNGGVFLSGPATAGNSLRIRVKAAPATPYTIKAIFNPLLFPATDPYCGILFRESGTGKLVSIHIEHNGQQVFSVSKWTNETTFSAHYVNGLNADSSSRLSMFSMTDNGVNLIFSFSLDGVNFLPVHTVSRTDFMAGAPNQIGFFANAGNASNAVGMTLLSWKQE